MRTSDPVLAGAFSGFGSKRTQIGYNLVIPADDSLRWAKVDSRMFSSVRLAFIVAASIAAAGAIYLTAVWQIAASIVSTSSAKNEFQRQPKAPTTLVEQVIIFNEFQHTWHVSNFPCATLNTLWADLTDSEKTKLGTTVSYHVARKITKKTDHSIKSLLTEIFTSCELGRRYNKEILLRYWLNHAYFGNGEFGIETASHSLFDKRIDELDIEEATHLAALLRIPALRNQPAKLAERAKFIKRNFLKQK